jgi:hypothetical protein
MSIQDVLVGIAPTIASALGGPLAGIAVGFIAKHFGVSEEQAAASVAGADPVKLRELEISFQEFLAANNIKIDLAQIEVNTEEAKSASVFVSGWRPFVGWVGGFALAYSAIIEPVARFGASVWGGYHGAFPVIDTTITMQVLTGLLGLGAMRSYDKKQGTSS